MGRSSSFHGGRRRHASRRGRKELLGPAVPPGRLVKVRYEDLTRDPPGTPERIYGGLGPGGFSEAAAAFEAYAAGRGGYRPNAHALSQAEREEVRRRGTFASDEWGYG